MKYTVELVGREVNIELTRAASKQLASMESSLKLEMELYFSCFIRKQVRIRQTLDTKYQAVVSDKLEIGFRPVMTRVCGLTDTDDNGKTPLTDFPIAKPECYVPHWLKLDYRKGEWQGDFGYIEAQKAQRRDAKAKNSVTQPDLPEMMPVRS